MRSPRAWRPRQLVSKEVLEGARAQLRHRVERLERRMRAAAGRGEAAAMNDLAAIRAALMPGGVRQERRLNYLPLLARHGDLLVGQLRAGAADPRRRSDRQQVRRP